MKIANLSRLSDAEFASIANEISQHTGLNRALEWAARKPKRDIHPQIVAEVVTQDEFTHDVILPFRNIFIVYDTT